MVIAQKAADNSPEMSFAENDNMVEAFPTQSSDHPFHIGRLPWTLRCDDDLLDVQGFHLFLKGQPIDSIAITDQVAWSCL
jgi:hypothetical protein